MYYDREGRLLGLREWGILHAHQDYRTVRQDRVRGWLCSTVWLGVDHSFGSGAPLIFETMIFPPDSLGAEEYQVRYATEALAVAGHAKALGIMRSWLGRGPLHVRKLTATELAGQ